jgi:uncharacterized membrane protein
LPLHLIQVGDDLVDGLGIVFVGGHLQQIEGIVQTIAEGAQGMDDGFQLGTLFAQRLRAFGVVPDLGVFEFTLDLG